MVQKSTHVFENTRKVRNSKQKNKVEHALRITLYNIIYAYNNNNMWAASAAASARFGILVHAETYNTILYSTLYIYNTFTVRVYACFVGVQASVEIICSFATPQRLRGASENESLFEKLKNKISYNSHGNSRRDIAGCKSYIHHNNSGVFRVSFRGGPMKT